MFGASNDSTESKGGSPLRPTIDRAAAVCYRRDVGSLQFLLVQTKGGGRWTFPKGGIEAGETPWQAAEREALEEAGVRGRISAELLTTYPHEKHKADGRSIKQTVAAYLLQVDSDNDPAEPGRTPTWFDPQEAKRRLQLKRDPVYQQACLGVIDEACTKLGHDASQAT
jgi:8-oxo-dGTP pyrophosphatase MutT (NUDIX family)